ENEPLIQEVELPKIARERGVKREQEAEPREGPTVKPRPSPQGPTSFGPESPFAGMDVQEEERPSGRMATGSEGQGVCSAATGYMYKLPEPTPDEIRYVATSLLEPIKDRVHPRHLREEAFKEWLLRCPKGTRQQFDKETATEGDLWRLRQNEDEMRLFKAKQDGLPYSQEMWDFTFWKTDNLWGTAEEWEAEAGRTLISEERMRTIMNLPKAKASMPSQAETTVPVSTLIELQIPVKREIEESLVPRKDALPLVPLPEQGKGLMEALERGGTWFVPEKVRLNLHKTRLDRRLMDMAIEAIKRGRAAAQVIRIPLGDQQPFPAPTIERVTADRLVIKSYSQNADDKNFYQMGETTMSKAIA
ncbi:MAG: hypothetical protein GY768_22110, partial [Planctomycetaceae bacterium]|nr:hypothetical protein [Planctomycetaceae bacterium]